MFYISIININDQSQGIWVGVGRRDRDEIPKGAEEDLLRLWVVFEAKLTPGFLGCQTWALVHIQLMTDNKDKQQKHYSRACWRDDGLHDRTSNLPPFDFSASFSWWFVVIVIIIVSIGCFIPRSVPSVIPGSSQLEACVRTCKTLRVY